MSGGREKKNKIYQKIIRIGSSGQPEVIQEEKTVLIGFDGQCRKNVDVSVSGSIVYSDCRGTKRRVIVEYVGAETVNVEVAKRIVVLEKRGDQYPEELRDEIFIYIGGLPEDIKQEMKRVRIIAGLTKDKPASQHRILQIGGEDVGNFTQKKQIILIGVSQRCEGILKLIRDRGRKLVQCVLEDTRNVVIEGESNTPDEAVEERVVEIIGSRGSVSENTEQREIVIQGGGPQGSVSKNTEQREIVIQGGAGPEVKQEAQEVVIQGQSGATQEAKQEIRIVGRGSDETEHVETKELVIFGQGPSGESIQGKIIEIIGAAGINVQNEKKYIEIGTGTSCNQQLHMFLNGSTINCRCGGKELKIQYIGRGPTDLEVMHQTFIIEGGGEMSELQNQDFVMVYAGGIPEQLKQEHETVVVTEVFSPEESGLDSKRDHIIELVGGRPVSNKNRRQIVVIGVSRKCDGILEKVVVGNNVQIHCKADNDREVVITGGSSESEVKEVKVTKQIAIRGQSKDIDLVSEAQSLIGDHYEKVLLIRGVEGKGVMIDNEILELGNGFKCEDYFDIIQEGSNIKCHCVGNGKNVTITYTGSSSTDFYISKHREILSKPQTEIQTSLKIYLGGKVQDIMRERRIVEVVKNMTSNQKNTVQKQIRFVANTHPRVHQIIEFGITRECNGRWDKIVQGNDIVIVCRKIGQRFAIQGRASNEEERTQRERIVVQGRGSNEEERSQRERIVVQGRGSNEEERTQRERIVVQGRGSDEEERSHRERIVVQGRGSNEEERSQRERIVVQGRGSDEEERSHRERIEVQGRGSDEEERSQRERIVVQGRGSNEEERIQREKIVVQGRGSNEEERTQRERIIVQGRGSNEEERFQRERIVVQGRGSNEEERTHREKIVVQGRGSTEEERTQRERIVVQGRGSDEEERSQRERIVVQGRGSNEEERTQRERIVVQGKGSNEEERTQRERIVVQGRGSDEEERSQRERIVVQGRGSDEEERTQRERIVVHGRGSNEEERTQRERIVVQGRGSNEEERTQRERILVQGRGSNEEERTQRERIVVQGRGSEDTEQVERERIVLHGGGPENNFEIIKKNETVIVQGQAPVKSSNTIVLRGGGGHEERDIVVLQGQGPDELETRQKNETFVLQGKGNDVEEEVSKKNKTIVIEGRDTDVEAEIRKEVNRTIVVKGEGPEKVKKEQQRVILTGIQREVMEDTTTTQRPTTRRTTTPEVIQEKVTLVGNIEDVTTKLSPVTSESTTRAPNIEREIINLSGRLQGVDRVSNKSVQPQTIGNISNDVIKIVLIGNHEYINLNQSDDLIDIQTKDRCEGNIKVTSENGRLSIKCVESQSGLDIVYIGKQDTNIEIKTHTRLKKITSGESTHDKVYIHLGGFKQTIRDGRRGIVVIPVRRNITQVEERLVYVNGMKEKGSENVVRIVDIGIRQTGCADNSLGKYTTEDGTVIYCGKRRADILPEEYDQESSDLVGKEFQRQTITLTGSQVRVESNESGPDVGVGNNARGSETNQVIGLDGEFNASGNSELKKALQFKVTSMNVSEKENISENRSGLSKNDSRTFSSSILRVTGRDQNETEFSENEEDRGPTRGDLSIAEYDKSVQDESNRQNIVESSNNAALTEGATRQLNVEVNKSVDIDVGNNCKGKVEVMESDGQVIVKCTVGGDIFEINLVGLYQKSSNKLQSGQTSDSIIEKEAANNELKIRGEDNKLPDHLLIQEVEYASHMRYLNKPESGGNILIRKMNLIDNDRNSTRNKNESAEIGLDKAGSPQVGFMETLHASSPRRGDVPIEYPIDDNVASYGYQSDSNSGHDHYSNTRHDLNGRNRYENNQQMSSEKHLKKSPVGNYASKKYGIDMEFIDHKYDDLSIRGFQHSFSTDFTKGIKRLYRREKYNIPTLKGSRVLKRIKTLHGARHPSLSQREYHRNQRYMQKHSNQIGHSSFHTDEINSKYSNAGIQQDTSARPVSDQKDHFLAKSRLGIHSETSKTGYDSAIGTNILLGGQSNVGDMGRESVGSYGTDFIKGKVQFS